MHSVAEDGLQVLARRRPHRLDAAAALAQHDRLLGVALDVDRLLDPHAAVGPGLPALGFHGERIRQLLAELAEEGLAGHFGGDQPLGHIGELVLGVMPGPRRNGLGKMVAEIADPVAFHGRNHEGVGEKAGLVQLLDQREELRPRHQVDLVDGEDRRSIAGFQAVDDARRVRIDTVTDRARGIDQKHDQVRIAGALPGAGDHGALQAPLGREDARRIDEDELGIALGDDPADDGARGLHLGRDDGDLGADQSVQKRRLAGIGRANQGDEAAAPGVFLGGL